MDPAGINVCNTPEELALAIRDEITWRLTGRLGYYLGRLPEPQEFHSMTLEYVDEREEARYSYGKELLLVVHMRDPKLVRFSAWDPITEAEVNGSAPGPGMIQRMNQELWSPFLEAFELPLINISKADLK